MVHPTTYTFLSQVLASAILAFSKFSYIRFSPYFDEHKIQENTFFYKMLRWNLQHTYFGKISQCSQDIDRHIFCLYLWIRFSIMSEEKVGIICWNFVAAGVSLTWYWCPKKCPRKQMSKQIQISSWTKETQSEWGHNEGWKLNCKIYAADFFVVLLSISFHAFFSANDRDCLSNF